MRTFPFAISIIFSIIVISCISPKKAITKNLNFRGEILEEYEVDKETYVIVKEGTNINQYRIRNYTSSGFPYAFHEKLYAIDIITKQCYKLFNEGQVIEIECADLKNDIKLEKYIE